ncbi:MAG: radical SAM family heme chaperone HemW [Planctomycetota bacterium]
MAVIDPISAGDPRHDPEADRQVVTTEWPRAAYIHVPFCRHRCGYCNFTLIAGRDDLQAAYLQALELELRQLATPRPVDTLFFGGGTPTHLQPRYLEQLLQLARHWFPPSEQAEISVEANPCDISADVVELLTAAGVNRLSLGVQSFHDEKLSLLERDHRRATILQAVNLAQPRFRSLGLDLIFGTPNETLDLWRQDLAEALACGISHLSTYGLTLERGTAFWSRHQRGEIAPLDESLERALYEEAIDRVTAAGWEHYEVSNFARPGHRCRHNETYWRGASYYAAGPGAARYVAGRREVNHRSTTTYLNRLLRGESPVAEAEELGPEDRARERLVFGLRRLEGVERSGFERETGFQIEQLVGHILPDLLAQELLRWQQGHLQLTRAGLCVSDAIWPHFL